MSLIKLPKMEQDEVEKLIRTQILCRIAFKGDKYPYLAPFQYVYLDGSLYFHFTDYGKKMKILEKDKRVAVEIEAYKPDLSEYNFVVIMGELEVVTNAQERARVIQQMAKEGKRKLSPNFLAAHGLRKEDGWMAFSTEKQLIIVKLKGIAETVALKSP